MNAKILKRVGLQKSELQEAAPELLDRQCVQFEKHQNTLRRND